MLIFSSLPSEFNLWQHHLERSLLTFGRRRLGMILYLTQLFFTMTGLLGVGVRPMLWPTYVSHSHKTDVVGLVRCSVNEVRKDGGVGWLAFWRLAR